MKLIFLFLCFFSFLFSTEVSCRYSLKANSIYNFSKLSNSSILSIDGEIEDNLIFGGLDPANSPIVYYDDRSAICGGKLDSNTIISAYCPYDIETCFDINIGASGLSLITKKDNSYTNNVVIADGYPCLPKNITTLTVSFYGYKNTDYADIGYGNFNLYAIEEERVNTLEKEEARIQREKCSGLIKYVDEWEELLDSQNVSANKILSNIDFSKNVIDELTTIGEENLPTLNKYLEVLEFEVDVKNTITDSFSKYSNIFGLDTYGSAPEPITFSLFGIKFKPLDFSNYESFVLLCRTSFSIFAYVWGFILIIKDIK